MVWVGPTGEVTSEQKKDGDEVKKKVSGEGQSDRGVSRDSKKKGFRWSSTWLEPPKEAAGGQVGVRGTGGGSGWGETGRPPGSNTRMVQSQINTKMRLLE